MTVVTGRHAPGMPGSPGASRTPGTPATSRAPGASRTPPPQKVVRTFDALPPAKGSRGPFAESWWGRAWLNALEESSLDSGRLQRGRTYARGGAAGRVTLAPGSVTAGRRAHRTGGRLGRPWPTGPHRRRRAC